MFFVISAFLAIPFAAEAAVNVTVDQGGKAEVQLPGCEGVLQIDVNSATPLENLARYCSKSEWEAVDAQTLKITLHSNSRKHEDVVYLHATKAQQSLLQAHLSAGSGTWAESDGAPADSNVTLDKNGQAQAKLPVCGGILKINASAPNPIEDLSRYCSNLTVQPSDSQTLELQLSSNSGKHSDIVHLHSSASQQAEILSGLKKSDRTTWPGSSHSIEVGDPVNCDLVLNDKENLKKYNAAKALADQRTKRLVAAKQDQEKLLKSMVDRLKKDGTQSNIANLFTAYQMRGGTGDFLPAAAESQVAGKVSQSFTQSMQKWFNGWHDAGVEKNVSADGFNDQNRPHAWVDDSDYSNSSWTYLTEKTLRNVVARNIKLSQSSDGLTISMTTYYPDWRGYYDSDPRESAAVPNGGDPFMPNQMTTTINVITGKVTHTLKNIRLAPMAENVSFEDEKTYFAQRGVIPSSCGGTASASVGPAATLNASVRKDDPNKAL